MKSLKEIQKELRINLDKDRYCHTIGVMYTAAALAMSHEIDMEKSMLAGLLHDCAKCIPNAEKYKLCEEYHIELNPSEFKNPVLVHAKLGAYLASSYYHISDETILNAIANHTTGRPSMTTLEQLIFIADYIEPGRKELPGLKLIRSLAFHDMDEAIMLILENTLIYLNKINKTIDPMTEMTYQYYKEKQNR
ncbi:MAG: bis(5'-nucleosyl)-tetraphosphatase (symmetrical) YqeK [Lachnospiraceae bacterium]